MVTKISFRLTIDLLACWPTNRENLTKYHLENAAEPADIDDSVRIIKAAIFEATEKSIPNKLVVIQPNDYPWITCLSLMRKKRHLYRKKDKQYASLDQVKCT